MPWMDAYEDTARRTGRLASPRPLRLVPKPEPEPLVSEPVTPGVLGLGWALLVAVWGRVWR